MRGAYSGGMLPSLAIFRQARLNQVTFCHSVCLCLVLWKIICVDESQWEIVLITAPNNGSFIVFVFLMYYLISDNGQVIGRVKCFVSYAGLSRSQWDPFSGQIVYKTTSDHRKERWHTMSAKNIPGDKVSWTLSPVIFVKVIFFVSKLLSLVES